MERVERIALVKVATVAEETDTNVFGFWIYLMTDLVIFAALFALFIVLRSSTYGGPSGHELFSLHTALAETLILLSSSFSCALAMVAVHRGKKIPALIGFVITFVLGVAFLVIEISEFSEFVAKGASWQRSAFLSSFFTLVGTHGLHISVGLLWMAVEMFRIVLRPLSHHGVSRTFRMALFWHFLDFVWIFIFTIVYGMGYLL
jgi:cytochrome o ubiquinol oxidase subunit III